MLQSSALTDKSEVNVERISDFPRVKKASSLHGVSHIGIYRL